MSFRTSYCYTIRIHDQRAGHTIVTIRQHIIDYTLFTISFSIVQVFCFIHYAHTNTFAQP